MTTEEEDSIIRKGTATIDQLVRILMEAVSQTARHSWDQIDKTGHECLTSTQSTAIKCAAELLPIMSTQISILQARLVEVAGSVVKDPESNINPPSDSTMRLAFAELSRQSAVAHESERES